MVFIIAYLAFMVVSLGIFIYTRDGEEEFYNEDPTKKIICP